MRRLGTESPKDRRALRCRKEADLEAAIKVAEERFGPLYLMVNNAGIMGAMGYLDEMGLPEFEATLAVNLVSVFLGSKHAIRQVLRQLL